MSTFTAKARMLRDTILDELYKAVGLSNARVIKSITKPILNEPAGRFAKIVDQFDTDISQMGLQPAAKRIVSIFTDKFRVEDANKIPSEGPLIIASNHPGTMDGLLIASSVARQDFKVIIAGNPFIRCLEYARKHLIYSTTEMNTRMITLRQSVQHLQEGGALMIFPSGGIDPDPAFMPGLDDTIRQWSPSLELFLRKVPETNVQLAMVGGIISKECVNNPLTNLRKTRRDRQRIAEFLQIIQQIVFNKKFDLDPYVAFADPFNPVKKQASTGGSPLQVVIDSALKFFQQVSEKACWAWQS